MEKAGMLDESLQYSMDYEFWIRLALAGATFYKRSDVVAQFRLSETSKTVSKSARMAEEQLKVLDRYLSMPGFPEQIGQSKNQVQKNSRATKSTIGLYAFYGSVKIRDWCKAITWFLFSVRQEPTQIFRRRWLDLAIAGIRRRLLTT
jgi:hypothetical protein